MIYTADELRAIGNWAVEHDILILADDIYGRLVYNGNKFTPIPVCLRRFASRRWSSMVSLRATPLTGWRIGYAVW